ncbi:GNAT family N-acetyltransferase [Seongchinamella sediminis]|uniref:GNAT family N-acetyltransferase n=1 Tax=Seongchinamella sediminis TaxID=2283635 RepID=A0A3L7DWK0_9GAMM|nr:GNAT family N-acetyltransferase [Seongchinamella sediminis]
MPFPYSEQDAIDWITHTTSSSLRMPRAVELDGHFVGCVSYWPHHPGGFEVGYWVGRDFWGKGVCTAALMRLMASDGHGPVPGIAY